MPSCAGFAAALGRAVTVSVAQTTTFERLLYQTAPVLKNSLCALKLE
jgi:hypothetical protein